jgi:hypothetical protein
MVDSNIHISYKYCAVKIHSKGDKMKKLLIVFAAMVLFTGIGLAEGRGDVIVKLGLDPVGNFHLESEGRSDSEGMKFGLNFSAEYLYPVHDIVKIGAGLEYMLEREVDAKSADKFSYLPIYAAVKVNPISAASEVFFKGNIGYNVLFNVKDLEGDTDKKGGLYWALGAGYEFDFGLVLEAMYGFYYSKIDFGNQSIDSFSIDYTYSKLGINIGYKFEL